MGILDLCTILEFITVLVGRFRFVVLKLDLSQAKVAKCLQFA